MKSQSINPELITAAKEFLNAYKLNYKAELELRRTDKALREPSGSLYDIMVSDKELLEHDLAIGLVVEATKNFVERMGEFARLTNVQFTTRDEYECALIDLANDIINSK
jgi:ribosomal protein L17